jgi:3-hydroxyisobutyrate dehydrogenase
MTANNPIVCAFIGLGNMGYPMAGHLATAGHEVRVFNRTRAKADAWAREHDGTVCATPAEAAAGADVVLVCVGGDDDVRAVLGGDNGALDVLAEGAIVIDHTTASATLAEELAASCADRGLGFVDAPISGGQIGAENGVLSVMCGADQAHFDTVEPVIDAYAATITLVGPPGSGQRTKMVNQILCAGAIQGAAEALAFGMKAGLDMDRVLGAVTKGAAGSWYLSNRGATMVADEFDFGFAVDWLAKDLGLVRDEADKLQADTPLTELTARYLAAQQEAGDRRLDATSIIRRYR